MSEWRDISTAPKDGTFILAYAPPDTPGEQAQAVVSWFEQEYERFEQIEGSEAYRRVVQSGGGWWDGAPWSPFRATHWKPLPEPPQ